MAFLAILIAAWAKASRLCESYLFPGPDDVAAALYTGFKSGI